MSRDVAEDFVRRTNLDGVVPGNGFVVLAILLGLHPNVAACLAHHLVTERF